MEDNKTHHENPEATTGNDEDLTSAVNTVQDEEKYIEDTEQIKKDLTNATTMLSYIVDQGLDIDPKHIESIVESKDLYKRKKWSKSAEISFYITYRELTRIIKPVTVDSLTSSRPPIDKVGRIGRFFGRKYKYSFAKKSTSWYMASTILCMILLLGIQIYFYLGSTRLDSIKECQEESQKIWNRMTELNVILESNPDNTQYAAEFEDCTSRLVESDTKISANIDLLEPWVQNLRRVSFNTTVETDTIAKQDIKYSKARTAILQEANSYRLILGIYVLPLLYGIIGGFTFVLRELTSEIKSLTFSTGSNIKYILRILLGAIAGLAIGLFWGDLQNAQKFGITSLSPMLLAFLGGYCVEYLLQFLERISSSFFNKNAEYYAKKPVDYKTSADKTKQEPADKNAIS